MTTVVMEHRTAGEGLVNIEDTAWSREHRHWALKGYRLRAGLTQREVAARSGIRQTVISKYENGRRPLTPAAAAKLGAALGVEPARLLE